MNKVVSELKALCLSTTSEVERMDAAYYKWTNYLAWARDTFAFSRQLYVRYDELRHNTAAQMARIFSFLRVPPAPYRLDVPIIKNQRASMGDVVSNAPELRAKLAGTRWAGELERRI